MNVLNRSISLINTLNQTIVHRNSLIPFLRHSFIYYRYSSTTEKTKITEITTTSTNKPTSVDIYKQAPNYDATWSKNQRTRKDAMIGPRFEQTDLEAQPSPLAAVELIAIEPIHYVEGRIAVCNGGGGALGHPQVYINLDYPGAHVCGYCGIRFEQIFHN